MFTDEQANALESADLATQADAHARAAALERLELAGFTNADDLLDKLIERLASAPITVNVDLSKQFHADGRTVRLASALAASERLRTVWEVGFENSGGGGGASTNRQETEAAMGYSDEAPTTPEGRAERPKYGALNDQAAAQGAAPKYGRSHLRLKPNVKQRSTVTGQDSIAMVNNAAMWQKAKDRTGEAVGPAQPALNPRLASDPTRAIAGMQLARLKQLVESVDPSQRAQLSGMETATVGVGYVEAQIHGDVTWDDVEAVVIDASESAWLLHRKFRPLARRYGFRIETSSAARTEHE